jgi:hypothetical protein
VSQYLAYHSGDRKIQGTGIMQRRLFLKTAVLTLASGPAFAHNWPQITISPSKTVKLVHLIRQIVGPDMFPQLNLGDEVQVVLRPNPSTQDGIGFKWRNRNFAISLNLTEVATLIRQGKQVNATITRLEKTAEDYFDEAEISVWVEVGQV